MGMGVQRKNQPDSKAKGRIGARGLDFCSRRWGNRDEESQGFPPRLGEFAMLGTPKWGWKDV